GQGEARRETVHGPRPGDRPGSVPDDRALEARGHDDAARGTVRQGRPRGRRLRLRDGAGPHRRGRHRGRAPQGRAGACGVPRGMSPPIRRPWSEMAAEPDPWFAWEPSAFSAIWWRG